MLYRRFSIICLVSMIFGMLFAGLVRDHGRHGLLNTSCAQLSQVCFASNR